jgi:hypothetical protein
MKDGCGVKSARKSEFGSVARELSAELCANRGVGKSIDSRADLRTATVSARSPRILS